MTEQLSLLLRLCYSSQHSTTVQLRDRTEIDDLLARNTFPTIKKLICPHSCDCILNTIIVNNSFPSVSHLQLDRIYMIDSILNWLIRTPFEEISLNDNIW